MFAVFIMAVQLPGVSFADEIADVARAASTVLRGAPSSVGNQTSTQNRMISSRTAPTANASITTDTVASATPYSRNVGRAVTTAEPSQISRTANDARAAVTRDAPIQSAVLRTVQSRSALSRTGADAVATGPTADSVRDAVTNRATINSGAALNTGATRPTMNAVNSSGFATRPQMGRAATPASGAIRQSIGNLRGTSSATISRAADDNAIATSMANKDYKLCRETFYACMDEFCATKNTQLKRCACSNRLHDFDSTKKQLEKVEDKLQDFNEKLLVVSMDEEDAYAMAVASEGESAFQQSDKSSSKKILDTIMKKLKSNTTETNTARDLSAISMSLDIDSAFDTIDFMQGAGTTAKEGDALYRAALPVCEDMIQEFCDTESVNIVKSAYQMAVEQDCNTVSKAYAARQDAAREKVREGSALLDMSRLDNYQTRNADDILTCKKKMLDLLADSSVCGTGYSKCLDWSGKYIDPGTGQAILSEYLPDLINTITRPTGSEKWASLPANAKFVSFLNAKKKYLEPAMANCELLADKVWTAFLEDALAQIKLSQVTKLEDMRQSCTTLTTTCIAGTATSLADFDSRALSVFGVNADKTVNEMCKSIRSACTALMQTTDGGIEWDTGIGEIATDKTYETVLSTCMQIGKNCIIQQCKNTSGNFGLCEGINSINRRNILNASGAGGVCLDEVQKCVTDAGQTAIAKIIERHLPVMSTGHPLYSQWNGSFYMDNFSHLSMSAMPAYESTLNNYHTPYDLCRCDAATGGIGCQACRIAEKIWGNCEQEASYDMTCPTTSPIWDPKTGQCKSNNPLDKISKTTPNTYRINRILPSKSETLLSWFATNTSTESTESKPVLNSCYGAQCPIGFVWSSEGSGTGAYTCVPAKDFTDDNIFCQAGRRFDVVSGTGGWTNCCPTNVFDSFGNCCANVLNATQQKYIDIDLTSASPEQYFVIPMALQSPPPQTGVTRICANASVPVHFITKYTDSTGTKFLFCVGPMGNQPYKSSGSLSSRHCNGKFMTINPATGVYDFPIYEFGADLSNVINVTASYYLSQADGVKIQCDYNPRTNGWTINPAGATGVCNKISGAPGSNHNLVISSTAL